MSVTDDHEDPTTIGLPAAAVETDSTGPELALGAADPTTGDGYAIARSARASHATIDPPPDAPLWLGLPSRAPPA